MNRREYLATTAVIVGGSFSGCSTLEEEVSLESPSEERSSSWIHFEHEYNDEGITRVSFTERSDTSSAYRLQTTISQPSETTIDRTRFRFKPESADGDSHDLFVQPLRDGRYDEFDTFQEDGWTVVEVHNHGEGTVSYEILAHQTADTSEIGPLTVDYKIKLSEQEFLGTTFIARNRATPAFE